MNKFNLSLDDMSPHPKAGLDFESIKWCNKIIEKYPDFKVNLFVPAAYCRLGEKPCYLSKNPEWIKKLDKLSYLNYRVNFHGYYHRRTKTKHPDSNNDEWQYLSKEQAIELMNAMEDEFARAGKPAYATFRPPGWKISRAAAEVLTKNNYIIAGNKEYYNKCSNIPNLKWISYNWDLLSAPPAGDVVAYGHTSNWTTNFMNEQRYNTIMNFLDGKKFKFCFIEDM